MTDDPHTRRMINRLSIMTFVFSMATSFLASVATVWQFWPLVVFFGMNALLMSLLTTAFLIAEALVLTRAQETRSDGETHD